MKTLRKTLGAIVGIAALAAIQPAAHGISFGFDRITSNAAQSVEDQFLLTVAAVDGGVSFRFDNQGPAASTITAVYFDDAAHTSATLLAIEELTGSSGVTFNQGANPSNVPGGKSLPVKFATTPGLLADANNPSPKHGVSPGEWLELQFSLLPGKSLDDVLQMMLSGNLRVAMHVQTLAGGMSDSFLNEPVFFHEPVPTEPPGVQVADRGSSLLLLGLSASLLALRRKRKKAEKKLL